MNKKDNEKYYYVKIDKINEILGSNEKHEYEISLTKRDTNFIKIQLLDCGSYHLYEFNNTTTKQEEHNLMANLMIEFVKNPEEGKIKIIKKKDANNRDKQELHVGEYNTILLLRGLASSSKIELYTKRRILNLKNKIEKQERFNSKKAIYPKELNIIAIRAEDV